MINDLATLTWLAQLASLEIHVPQWRFGRNGQPRNPDRLVLDLDPGPGVSLTDCAEIALLVRDILRDIGHDPVPVTRAARASTCTPRWMARCPPTRPPRSPGSWRWPSRPTTATG